MFTKLRDVQSPTRAHDTDSGIDFFIPNKFPEDFEIKVTPNGSVDMTRKFLAWKLLIRPGQGVLIPSGIAAVIEPWYDLVLDNKSGMSTKWWFIVGAKVVDSSYRGEIHLHLINASDQIQELELWQKVVQGIIRKVELCNPTEITQEEFDKESNTDRGAGGFGSTGS